MTSTGNLELVKELFAAVAQSDIEAAIALVHPDAEWVNPDYAMEPGVRSGMAGVRTALTALRDSFAELSFDIDEMIDMGDRVLVVGTFSGLGRASKAAFGPQSFGSVVTLTHGRVRRYEWYLDPDEARRAAEPER
jgi:ketosteroid isomerase-like protein